MKDPSKANAELIKKLSVLRPRIQELEQSESEHKKTEEALKACEEKYRVAFEGTSDSIFTVDHFFNILSITPNVERQLSYKAEEIINGTIQDLNILTSEFLTKAVSDVIRVLSCVEVTSPTCEGWDRKN